MVIHHELKRFAIQYIYFLFLLLLVGAGAAASILTF